MVVMLEFKEDVLKQICGYALQSRKFGIKTVFLMS